MKQIDGKLKADFSVLAHCAVRYAMGRCSTAPYEVTSIIKQNIDLIHPNVLKLILRDVESEEEHKRLGMDIDVDIWMEFKGFIKRELEQNIGAEKCTASNLKLNS